MEEIWKDIEGYENLYQVSSQGRVRSLPRNTTKGQIIKPSVQNTGYYYVLLYKDGKALRKTLHRIIAKAFIPNPENKPQVDHINGIKTDCRIENLRWVTPSENNTNPHRCEAFSVSKKGKGYKKVLQYSMDGEFIREWCGSKPAALSLGKKSASHIIDCISGRKNSAYGFKWRYAS